MVFGLVAIVLVLICLLVWLNILMVRRGRKDSSHTEAQQMEGASSPSKAQQTPQVGLSHASFEAPASEDALSAETDEGDDSVTSVHITENAANWDAVEVVPEAGTGSRGRKLFERKERPYVFHGASVPEFDREDWHQCFYRLTEDPLVMGWIGFQEDTVGACDREYDDAFVDTLRTYHRSVMKLQREVGLSNVLETSVVGEEGKVWLLTGNEDVWFALFVERDADLKKISQGFMAQLTATEPS